MAKLQIDIFEGGRGTGKSTIAFKLRQKTPETTLINFTGFHTDGEEGLRKVSHYYESFMMMLFSMVGHESKFVFDRFYFSEQVFSQFYKEYDFTDKYNLLNAFLEDLADMVDINIFFLTINDKDELKQRLMRDKVPFGKAEESVEQTFKQQEEYAKLFNTLKYKNGIRIHTIDTSGKTNDEVYDEIVQLKTTN